MSQVNQHGSEASSASHSPVERLVRSFEGAWHRGEHPRIEQFLPTEEQLRRETLPGLVQVDLRCRLQSQQHARIEEYFRKYPELEVDRDVALELIAAEYKVRQGIETAVGHAEYIDRFPQYRAELQHRLIALSGGESERELQLDCPHCRKSVHIVYTNVNQEIPCPNCRGPIRVDASLTHTSFSTVDVPEDNRPSELNRIHASTDRPLADRYEVCEKIGEGGMAVVFRVRDVQTSQEFALKAMKTRLGGTAQKRFLREFTAVSSVRHPHCVQVFDFGETPDFPYFTMELFTGEPLTALRGQPLPVLLQALHQAASAIDHVHAQGIVHRDVKPSNLLTLLRSANDGGQPDVLVKLTDFGLARFTSAPSSLTVKGGYVGTLAYSAPEQIANEMIDHRVDLYSLGVVCYELLAGRHPFEESRHVGVPSLMRAQLTEPPPPLRQFAPEVPQEVADAVTALLAKQPAERPPSARLLRDVLARYAGVEAAELTEPPALSVAQGQWTHPAFVARQEELSVARRFLHQALSTHGLSREEWARQPVPSVIFIEGEAGIGKSRLLQEVVRMARGIGASVFDGRCFQGNLAPYQAFVDILGQIVEAARTGLAGLDKDRQSEKASSLPGDLRSKAASGAPGASTVDEVKSQPTSSTAVSALIEHYSPELLRIAPDLRKHLAGEAFKQMDLSRETNYVLRAVANFFVEMSTSHAACLCIEDLQWADQGTLELLRHLSSALYRTREHRAESKLSGVRLVVCCTIRSGGEGDESLVRELRRQNQAAVLELKPLSRTDVSELIHLLLGPPDDQLVDVLYRRSHGNAFFVCECLRAWLSSDRLVRRGGRWVAAAAVDDKTSLPESVREVLRARLQALEPAGRQVLATCAVIGSVVQIDTLRQCCIELTETEFLDALDELIATKTVFETGSGFRLEFAHDLLREVVYEELSASRRHALHRQVAEVLESRSKQGQSASPEALALHFSEAGIQEKAFHYLMEAAEAALRAYAADDAIGHLLRARDLAPASLGHEQTYRLHDLLAAAHTAAGHPVEAISFYRKNLESAADPFVRARILEKIGQLHFRVSEFDPAVDCFDRALAQLGLRRPRYVVTAVASIIASFARYFWPRWLRLSRPLKGERRTRALIARDVFNGLMYVWIQRSVVQCTQATGRQFVLAERIGEPAVLADAYAKHALHFAALSLNRAGVLAGKQALASAALSADPEVEAIAKGHVACIHYTGSRFAEAERLLREALTVLDRRGYSWFRMFFYHNLRHLYAIVADTEQEIASAKAEMEIGEAVHDPEGTCWGAYGMANALARSGRLDEAHRYIQRAIEIICGRTNIVVVPTAMQTYGFVHLQSGDYHAARQVLEDARRIIEQNFAFVDYSIRCYPLLVESILGARWHDRFEQLNTEDVRHSWRMSWRGLIWAWRLPNYRSHALRVRGRTAFVRGKRQAAIGYFHRAIAAAERIGARYDLARACLDLAKVCDDGREEYERRGREILQQLGATVPEPEL